MLCVSDVTELHVHHAERQQSLSCKDLFGCNGGALQKEYMVGFICTLDYEIMSFRDLTLHESRIIRSCFNLNVFLFVPQE